MHHAADLLPRLTAPLQWFWWFRSHFGEGRGWLTPALPRARGNPGRATRLLGEQAFAAARPEGRAMSTAQAIAYATDATTPA